MPATFGETHALTQEELDVIDARTLEASRIAKALKVSVETWQSETTFTTHINVQEPERTSYDIHVEASHTYPHDQWATQASNLAHQLRSALENLNDRLFARFVTESYNRKRIQFPMISTEKDWRNWKKSHSALPDWIINRYSMVQPLHGPNRILAGLAAMNNQDKHMWLVRVGVVPTSLIASTKFTVEGLSTNFNQEIVNRDFLFNRGQRKIHLATVVGDRRIAEAAPTSGNKIEPKLHFFIGNNIQGDEFFTIEDITEIPRRIRYVIDYVNGDASALVKYQSAPAYVGRIPKQVTGLI